MNKELLQQQAVEDEELHRLHQTETRKCLTEFRSKMSTAETEVQERINLTFQSVKEVNNEARGQIFSSLNRLIEGQVNSFVTQLEQFLAAMMDFDEAAFNMKYGSMKAHVLRCFAAAVKDVSPTPAITRKVKKEFEATMEAWKQKVIDERKQELVVKRQHMQQRVAEYTEKMREEMRNNQYMDRVEAEALHRQIVDTHCAQWKDDMSRSVLRQLMTQSFDHLWDKLQLAKGKREKRILALADRLRNRHRSEMNALIENKKKIPQSIAKLTQEHDIIQNKLLRVYKNNIDVKPFVKHLTHVEQDLSANIAEDFEKMKLDFNLKRKTEQIKLQINFYHRLYNRSMGEHFIQQPPQSVILLQDAHHKIMSDIVDRFSKDGLVASFSGKDVFQDRLRILIESEFEKKKAAFKDNMQRHQELKAAMNRDVQSAYQNFVQMMQLDMTHMSDVNKRVMEEDVQDAFLEFQNDALILFYDTIPADLPAELVRKGESLLLDMTNDDYDHLVQQFVTVKTPDTAGGFIQTLKKRLSGALSFLSGGKGQHSKSLTTDAAADPNAEPISMDPESTEEESPEME